MKIRVSRSRLFEGLKKVQSGANAKCAMPICGNVKIAAENGVISLTTTNLDITVYSEVEGEVDEAGAVTIPASRLMDAVGKAIDGEVEIEGGEEGGKIRVSAGSCSYAMPGRPVGEFPKLPSVSADREFKVDAAELIGQIKKTSYAMSTDDTRRILENILMEFGKDKIRCVATDGRRLAVADGKAVGDGVADACHIVVPANSLAAIQTMLAACKSAENKEIVVKVIGTQVVFIGNEGKHCVYTRLYDGAYPNYMQVVPKDNDKTAVVDREILIDALERVAVMVSNQSTAVKLTFSNNSIGLEVKDDDMSDAHDIVPVKYDGEKIELMFNPKYILDPLRSATSDEVVFSLKAALAPAMIKCKEEHFLCVLMPLRTN